jgi:hypothetical protein
MASLEFTPVVPTLAGTTFATTAVTAGSDEYDYIPISASMRTVVVITNSDSAPHTVTFTSQADEWGNTGACMNKAITIGANKTYITGVWLRNRWAAANTPTAAAYTCTVSYSAAADMSVAVITVPNVDKN